MGKLKRKPVTDSVQAEVLVKSRRRCCVCFGLHQDHSIKQGQIAHLDQNRQNNSEDNLAFLCLPHHDQYDSQTSQSKNLTKKEVEKYREELYQHFSVWNHNRNTDQLLNFLSAYVDTETIAKTILKIGQEITLFPEFPIKMALTESKIELIDGDIAMPLLHVLDHLAAWGFLTYEFLEPTNSDSRFDFKIIHKNLDQCKVIAKAVEQLGKSNS